MAGNLVVRVGEHAGTAQSSRRSAVAEYSRRAGSSAVGTISGCIIRVKCQATAALYRWPSHRPSLAGGMLNRVPSDGRVAESESRNRSYASTCSWHDQNKMRNLVKAEVVLGALSCTPDQPMRSQGFRAWTTDSTFPSGTLCSSCSLCCRCRASSSTSTSSRWLTATSKHCCTPARSRRSSSARTVCRGRWTCAELRRCCRRKRQSRCRKIISQITSSSS